MERKQITKNIVAFVDGETLTVEQSWKQFAPLPSVFLILFTGVFTYLAFKNVDPATGKTALSFFETEKYALFLVWGLFTPAILLFYFSKTSAMLNSKTIACKNTIFKFSYYNHIYTRNSIQSFMAKVFRIGVEGANPIEKHSANILLKNDQTVLIFKLDNEEDALKVCKVFEEHYERLCLKP